MKCSSSMNLIIVVAKPCNGRRTESGRGAQLDRFLTLHEGLKIRALDGPVENLA